MDQILEPNPLAKRYDGVARKWCRKIERLGYPAAYRSLIAAQFKAPQHGVEVLDAGTGAGDFSKAYLRASHRPAHLTLLDISTRMLEVARREIRRDDVEITCTRGGIEQMATFARYDVILCAHVIEHCDDPAVALANLFRALKPGGVLLLVASKPHWCTALIRLIWGHKAFLPSVMHTLLARAGFQHASALPFTSGPPSRTSMGYIAQKSGENHDNCNC